MDGKRGYTTLSIIVVTSKISLGGNAMFKRKKLLALICCLSVVISSFALV